MLLKTLISGEGEPLVFLHGLFGSAQNYRTFQRKLSSFYRVLAPDLRNHGQSPHAFGMTYADMALDVEETLQAENAVPAIVIGHSMGGKTAMQLALKKPSAVKKLIVMDIAPRPYRGGYQGILEIMQRLTPEQMANRKAVEDTFQEVEPDPAVRSFLTQNLRFTPHPAWRIGVDEILAGMADIMDWQPPALTPDNPEGIYQGPAFFICGERSLYVRPEDHAEIKRLFPAAKVLTLKEAGHWVHSDQPMAFEQILEEILRS